MDKWTHQTEPLLGVQLPTPVTLGTYCLVHNHVLVELMGIGHLLNLSARVSLSQHLEHREVQVPLFSTVVDCGPAADLINGQVNSSNGTIFGSVATFTCTSCYRLSHQQVVMCGGNRMWFPASPTCQSTSKF